MFALIQKSDNTILRVSEEGRNLAESKPFYWLECPADCTTEWAFNGDIFSAPVIASPTPEEYQTKVNAEARAYLASTDWYAVRFAETGVVIPADIAAARQSAREAVV